MHPRDIFNILLIIIRRVVSGNAIIPPVRFGIEKVVSSKTSEDLKSLPSIGKTMLGRRIYPFFAAFNAFIRELLREDEIERRYWAGYHISQIERFKEEGKQMMRDAIKEYENLGNFSKAWFLYYNMGDSENADRALKQYYLKKYDIEP
ncbi:MAG: hypothetical protein QXQ18_00130 [Candidatus Aenigmatarchaeota archaeon]